MSYKNKLVLIKNSASEHYGEGTMYVRDGELCHVNTKGQQKLLGEMFVILSLGSYGVKYNKKYYNKTKKLAKGAGIAVEADHVSREDFEDSIKVYKDCVSTILCAIDLKEEKTPAEKITTAAAISIAIKERKSGNCLLHS